jgi:hypothetical protein
VRRAMGQVHKLGRRRTTDTQILEQVAHTMHDLPLWPIVSPLIIKALHVGLTWRSKDKGRRALAACSGTLA